MNYSQEILETLDAIKQVQDDASGFRSSFSDQEDVLSFFLPSTNALMSLLKSRLKELIEQYIGSLSDTPDIWISLEGESIKEGRAPLSLVAHSIGRIVRANQHAVSLLDRIDLEAQRITKRIRTTADLDLVATAPGSLKIGLKRQSIDKYFYYDPAYTSSLIDEGTALSIYKEAMQEIERPIRGLQLLLKAVTAASSRSDYDSLQDTLKEKSHIIKILHYASEIAPPRTSAIERIVFSGITDGDIVATKETRAHLKAIEEQILEEDKYIEAVGIIREVDLDSFTCRINDLHSAEQAYNDVDCVFSKADFAAEELSLILGKQVRISGLLQMSGANTAKSLDVDSVNTIGEEE